MVVVWLVLGVVLLAFELRHVAFYALFAAVGCFAAALTALLVANIPLEVAVAVVVAGLGIGTVRPMMSRRFNAHEDHGPLGRGVAGALVGEEVLTLDRVGDVHEPGHVKLAGERWLATSGPGAPIPQGTKVLVTAVAGTTLVVWPVDGVVAPELGASDGGGTPSTGTVDAPDLPEPQPGGPTGSNPGPQQAGKEPS